MVGDQGEHPDLGDGEELGGEQKQEQNQGTRVSPATGEESISRRRLCLAMSLGVG